MTRLAYNEFELKIYSKKEISTYDGKYDEDGYYMMENGDYFSPDGHYYDADGFDENGGYTDP